MIFGGLLANGVQPSEIDRFTRDEALFWWGCIAAFNERVKEETETR